MECRVVRSVLILMLIHVDKRLIDRLKYIPAPKYELIFLKNISVTSAETGMASKDDKVQTLQG